MDYIIDKDLKRVWIISDTHFGVRNNSLEWLDIQMDYFYNFFIPLVKENCKEGDMILHMGDVFDSRQSVNIKIMNAVVHLFTDLVKILPITIIVGNHDIYHKYSNDIHSLKVLDQIDGIDVYTEPLIMTTTDAKLMLMPWRYNHDKTIEALADRGDADYLFAHTDFAGVKMNRSVQIDGELQHSNVKSFKRVYSGHIHYAQVYKNIRMVGCPYQMTRSDTGNSKNVFLLDLKTDEETVFPNLYSPIFTKISIEKLIELTGPEIKDLIKNNFVDIYFTQERTQSFPYNLFMELIAGYGYRKISYKISETMETENRTIEISENVSMKDLIDMYFDSLSYSDDLKNKMKKYSQDIHDKISKQNEV